MIEAKTKSQPSIAKSASRMGFATFLSRILGLAREQVFAYLFGASDAADAFNIAFRIPNLLRDLFAEGAMSAAFVPNFTRALLKTRALAFSLLISVLALLLVGLSGLSLIGGIFADKLIGLYAGAYHAVPGKFELAVGLARTMFPSFPLVAMAAVSMGALNALGFFFLPAFAPVLFNVASILAGVALCPFMQRLFGLPSIYGMAIGVVAGGFLQFYIQWWQLKRQGVHATDFARAMITPPWKHWSKPDVRSVLWLLIPGTIGLAAAQLNILINSIYATSQGTGPVSWLNYAFRLMQFPIGIFGVSLASATLPQVSRKFANQDYVGAGRDLNQSLRLSFAVNLPAAAGLIVVGLPIIQLLFQHGHFTLEDSMQTTQAVSYYALGLTGYSMVKILVPIFYALGTTRVPVVASFLAVGLNAALNHVFLRVFHYPFWALAAATSVTVSLNAVFLLFWLTFLYREKLPQVLNLRLLGSFLSHLILSTAIGFACHYSLRFSNIWVIQVGFSIIIAFLLWIGLGKILRIGEIDLLWQRIIKR